MDDLLTGANTIQDALKLRNDLRVILETAGFELRQWSSNHNTIICYYNR